MRPLCTILALFATVAAGCDAAPEREASSERSPRPVPPGTAPRGTAAYHAAMLPPGPVAAAAVQVRGAERYAIFCQPCHGPGGEGDGLVVRAGFPSPPSFLDERPAGLDPAAIVAVITEGKGRMQPMAERVPPEDRWAIAHYVQTLRFARQAAPSPGGPSP